MSSNGYNPFDHHKGPFTFGVIRLRMDPKKGQAPYTYEYLRGAVEKEDIEQEARALLADMRDTITSVLVFNGAGAHVRTYREDQL